MTTASILLTRVDAGRNMARYYFLALQPGLFEEWAVRDCRRSSRGRSLGETLS